MDFLIAVILGVVQGLTEFLPISSSGHLVILERLTGFKLPALTFHVFLHAGSLIAVILVLWSDVARLAGDTKILAKDCAANAAIFFRSVKGADIRYRVMMRNNTQKLAALILTGGAVTGVIAFLLHSAAEEAASSLFISGVGLFVTGILLVVTDMVKQGDEIPKDVPLRSAFLIGAAQGFSVFPGLSRTAVAACSGIFVGFNTKTAFRTSCLMYIPVSLGALIYEVTEGVRAGIFAGNNLWVSLAGMAAAALTGTFFLRHAMHMVRSIRLKSFAYYCFAVGAVSVFLSYLL